MMWNSFLHLLTVSRSSSATIHNFENLEKCHLLLLSILNHPFKETLNILSILPHAKVKKVFFSLSSAAWSTERHCYNFNISNMNCQKIDFCKPFLAENQNFASLREDGIRSRFSCCENVLDRTSLSTPHPLPPSQFAKDGKNRMCGDTGLSRLDSHLCSLKIHGIH